MKKVLIIIKDIILYTFAAFLFLFAFLSTPFGLHNILFFLAAALTLPVITKLLKNKLKWYKPFMKWIALITVLFWALISLGMCAAATAPEEEIIESGSFDAVEEEESDTTTSNVTESSSKATSSSSKEASKSASQSSSKASSSASSSTKSSATSSAKSSVASSSASASKSQSVSSSAQSSAPSPAPEPETEPAPTPEPAPEESAPESSGGSTGGNIEYNGYTVYRTPSGKRYHYTAECAGKNAIAITLQEAEASGLTGCGTCVLQ